MFPRKVLGEANAADLFEGVAFCGKMINEASAEVGTRDGLCDSDGACGAE